jgi:hypothetical protein
VIGKGGTVYHCQAKRRTGIAGTDYDRVVDELFNTKQIDSKTVYPISPRTADHFAEQPLDPV